MYVQLRKLASTECIKVQTKIIITYVYKYY